MPQNLVGATQLGLPSEVVLPDSNGALKSQECQLLEEAELPPELSLREDSG